MLKAEMVMYTLHIQMKAGQVQFAGVLAHVVFLEQHVP